jgi:hypothetical protein
MGATVEEIFREARSLPPEERDRLLALLEAQRRAEEGHKSLEQLAAEQGTKPLRFEELQGEPAGDEEGEVDEFLAELERWRNQPSSRTRPWRDQLCKQPQEITGCCCVTQ